MTDWITGEKFIGVADFVYYPKGAKDCNPLENTFCPCALKEKNIVYTHTLYVRQLFEEIKKIPVKFVVVTHNCDENINESYLPLPDNVIRWFTQNVNVKHSRIESIPIGLENDKWFKNLHKKEKMLAKLEEPKKYKNLVYLNSNIKTNLAERQPLYDLFADKSWTTAIHGVNGQEFDEYLDNIYNHKFVFCPNGNGIDTHRLWETLYMKSVPIVKRDINNWFYNKLPILYVDDWSEVTKKKLDTEWDMFNWTFNKEKLRFSYWENKIRSYA